ncbi:MAG: ABC transporter ATP-binding protein [Bacteroidetes bacterium]|nr:MAG: ABC transporter ATP-binding protein [Bacteroidota bacterium]
MQQPIINVENVKKSFRTVKAVQGISLTIAPGEFVAILGPNGAGKTTLVEMIEGIQKPDEGEILIKGMPWKGNEHKLNRILGISLQETWFIEKLTVFETLRLFASFYRLDKDRALEIMHIVELQEKKNAYTKNLSGGQRQRLALGISLLNYPELLLLDEPTTGLDPNARHDIWEILHKLKDEKNTSLVLTTHYMEEAEFLCDRIVIVDKGKVLAMGTMEELLAQCSFNEIIEIGFEEEPGIRLHLLPGVLNVRKNTKPNLFALDVTRITQTLPVLLKELEERNVEVQTLICRKPTLDDLFISLTGRHLNA